MIDFVERKSCPVCFSNEYKILLETQFDHSSLRTFYLKQYKGRLDPEIFKNTSHTFKLNQCEGCTFVWQNPILNSEGMHLLYDKWIDPKESFQKNISHNSNYFKYIFLDVLFVSTIFKGRKPNSIRILDFGMGWGTWIKAAIAHGFNACGAELSQSRIENAEKLSIRVIKDLASSEEEFDYINTEQSLEHIDDLNESMSLLSHKLTKNGIIRVSVPPTYKELKIVKRKKQPTYDAFRPLEHINGFNYKSLQKLANRNHLEIAGVSFFFKLMKRKPQNSLYILKRMISHFFLNNTLLIKSSN